MTLPKIGADAELNLTQWSRSVQAMLADAQRIDTALSSIVGSMNTLESNLGFGGDVNLAVAVDTSHLEQAVDLQELLNQNTGFTANADDAEIQTATGLQDDLNENTAFVASADDTEIKTAVGLQNELDQNTTFKTNVDSGEIDGAKRKHDDLDQNTSFTANVVDTEIDSAKRKRDDLDTNVSMTVNVEDGEIQDALDDIKKFQVVDIAFNVAQTSVDFFRNIADFSVGGLIEMDDALGKLEGTTGRMIPGAERLIRDLYVNAWGESRTQIADVIALATQLGISETDLAGAIESAFQVASVTGYDVTEILKAQDSLVKNELAKDYKEAGNVIVAGFQNGGDRAEDLLETLVEYGSTFNDLGLSAEEATNILVNAMDNGFKNTDLAADALREFNIRVRDLNDAAAQGAIERLGLKDAADNFRNGTIAGDEFLSMVIDRLDDMEDPAQRQITAVEIFGTQLEDIGTSAIKGLDPTIDKLGDVRDRAETASDKVNNNLATAFTQLKRTVETELGDFLNETFDIDGLIDRLKTGVQTFFDELGQGQNIFAAAEIAFDLPGLENTMQGIQRTFADIGIAMLQVVSEIMSILGKDTSSIQRTIADLATVQLRADIFAADSEENLISSIERALGRGVDKAAIGDTIAGQIQGMIDSGDFEGAISLMNLLNTEFSPDELDFSPIGSALQSEIDTAFADAFNANQSGQVVELLPMISFAPAALQAINDKLIAALEDPVRRFNETPLIVDYAELLSNSTGEIDFTTLRQNVGAAAADEITQGLWAGLADSIGAQDWNTAIDYAQMLGRDELGSTMDDLLAQVARLDIAQISTTASGIMDAIGGIFDTVDTTEAQVADDGESISTTFSDVGESAGDAESDVDRSTGRMQKSVEDSAAGIQSSGRDVSKSFRDVSSSGTTSASELSSSFGSLGSTVVSEGDKMQAVLAQLVQTIDQLGKSTSVIETTATGISSGLTAAQTSMVDFDSAGKGLLTSLEQIKAGMDATAAVAGAFGSGISASSKNSVEAINALRDNGTAGLQNLLNTYTDVVSGWETETARLIKLVNDANAAVAGLNTAPPSGGGGGFTDTMMSVSPQMTNMYTPGSPAMMGGSSESTYNIAYNFYTNSTAQDLSSMGQASRNLRGFN